MILDLLFEHMPRSWHAFLLRNMFKIVRIAYYAFTVIFVIGLCYAVDRIDRGLTP